MLRVREGGEAVERSRAVLPWRELNVSAVCDRVRRCRPSDVDETTSPRSILQTRFECRASHRHSPAAGPLSRAARILHIVRLGDSFPIRNCSPNPWGCPCTGRPSGTCRPFRSRRSLTRRAGRGRSARAAAAARRGGAPGSRRSQSTPSEGVKGRLRELRRIAPDCAELRSVPRSHETTGAAIRSKIMMMPSSAYPHVKSFASGDVGAKSP